IAPVKCDPGTYPAWVSQRSNQIDILGIIENRICAPIEGIPAPRLLVIRSGRLDAGRGWDRNRLTGRGAGKQKRQKNKEDNVTAKMPVHYARFRILVFVGGESAFPPQFRKGRERLAASDAG